MSRAALSSARLVVSITSAGRRRYRLDAGEAAWLRPDRSNAARVGRYALVAHDGALRAAGRATSRALWDVSTILTTMVVVMQAGVIVSDYPR